MPHGFGPQIRLKLFQICLFWLDEIFWALSLIFQIFMFLCSGAILPLENVIPTVYRGISVLFLAIPTVGSII
jgi:hypothetical protein